MKPNCLIRSHLLLANDILHDYTYQVFSLSATRAHGKVILEKTTGPDIKLRAIDSRANICYMLPSPTAKRSAIVNRELKYGSHHRQVLGWKSPGKESVAVFHKSSVYKGSFLSASPTCQKTSTQWAQNTKSTLRTSCQC